MWNTLILKTIKENVKSYLHFIISSSASAADVTRIRILLFEEFPDLVLFTVDVTLGLGSLFQMITVVFCRATTVLFFVHGLATERLVIRQWTRTFRFIALVFSKRKDQKSLTKNNYPDKSKWLLICSACLKLWRETISCSEKLILSTAEL